MSKFKRKLDAIYCLTVLSMLVYGNLQMFLRIVKSSRTRLQWERVDGWGSVECNGIDEIDWDWMRLIIPRIGDDR